jgi:DNA-binding response OmpR family regulator
VDILVVEDNPDILAIRYGFLEPRGYTIDVHFHAEVTQ